MRYSTHGLCRNSGSGGEETAKSGQELRGTKIAFSGKALTNYATLMKLAVPTLLPLLLLAARLHAAGLESPDDARIDARMMQMPAVSATQIAFCYAGDIWIAPKAGGLAARLSSPRGAELFPRFSPDGKHLAFTGNYEGNEDIYVMPAAGGDARRVTHHGAADRVLGWYPDGKSLLFASKMRTFTERVGQFYRVSAGGGLPEPLPVPYGEFGAISPDGTRLAYTISTTDFSTWKRYRGGMAPDIWLYDLASGAAENLTHDGANDSQPMWRGSTLYFLSDRDTHQRRNLWARDGETGALRQLTFFTDADVHFPSIGPDDIVFEAKGRLHLLDLSSEKLAEVAIHVVTDRATLRPRVESVAPDLRTVAISPTGKRALFEARGEIFSVPAGEGIVRNLTESSGVAERYPAWSPNGNWIAYFSDRTGEYELTIRPADGRGAEKTLTALGAGWRYQPQWSPDSRKIAFIDSAMRLRVYDFDSKEAAVIDQQLWHFNGELARFRVSWSSDSRWIAYARDQENRQSGIALYDMCEGVKHQVTSGFTDDDLPAFDPEGKYLFYRSKRNFEPIYSEFDNTWIYANGQVIVAVPLRREVASPLAPRNDEEPMSEPKTEEPRETRIAETTPASPAPQPAVEPAAPKSDDADRKQIAMQEEKRPAAESAGPGAVVGDKFVLHKPKRAGTLDIDLEDFESRGVVLPINGGRFDELLAAPGKVIFSRQPRVGNDSGLRPLCFYDLVRREENTILDDVGAVDISGDGRKLLVGRGRAWAVINIAEGQRFSPTLPLGALEMTIDPRAEWRQIFADAWRMERDFFYDPQLHGVDWTGMRERYGKLLDDCVTRWDVNYVLGEMLGELSASHVYRGGGDVEEGPGRSVGYLGCDFALEQGAYRIARILEVAPWEGAHRSPLRQPGVKVKEGDFLLAVNGRRLDTSRDPWAAFQGLAERTVMLTVNSKPTLDGARDVLVQTVGDESRMRQLAWVENNRRCVEAASGGRAGYIYVRNTAADGQSELYRQFRAQWTKPALVIDERWNSGGQIPDRFIELLGRKVTNHWGVRDGRDWQTPAIAHTGPKAMLVNGWSGSGGDCMPWMFRKAGLGPVIGQRTWGGLIGMTGVPLLIDGGHVTVPTFSIYDTDGSWIIEGSGVEPDITVIDDPAAFAKGRDPQLERAIAEMVRSLEANPPAQPKRPANPNRSGLLVDRPPTPAAPGLQPVVLNSESPARAE
jgi:tricorn protease